MSQPQEEIEQDAQSFGAEALSDLIAEQSENKPAPQTSEEKRWRSRSHKEFSNGFANRLMAVIPQGIQTDFFYQGRGNAISCRIDLSGLSGSERMACAAKLIDLEETDKSVRSLKFENNYATLISCLPSREKH